MILEWINRTSKQCIMWVGMVIVNIVHVYTNTDGQHVYTPLITTHRYTTHYDMLTHNMGML